MSKFLAESTQSISINGDEVAYVLKRSKKRKRSISMRFNRDNKLQINAPFWMNQSIINDFMIDKYAWIKKQQVVVDNKKKTEPFTYQNSETHDFMGKQYQLCLMQSGKSEVLIKDKEILVFHRKNSSIKTLLENWYKKQALTYFTQRTQQLRKKYDFPAVNSIKVRNMKARWGSCSSQSNITYNTHLIKKSDQCIDYVILHELCHLIHLNHSAQFYRLQTHVNPDWKLQKQQLNSN